MMEQGNHGVSFDGNTLTVRCTDRDWDRMINPKVDAQNALYETAVQIKWFAKFRFYYADLWVCDGLICRKNKRLFADLVIGGTLRDEELAAEPLQPLFFRENHSWVFFVLIDGVYKKLSYGISPDNFVLDAFAYFRPWRNLPLLRDDR